MGSNDEPDKRANQNEEHDRNYARTIHNQYRLVNVSRKSNALNGCCLRFAAFYSLLATNRQLNTPLKGRQKHAVVI
jgi:hypothetical protein